MTERVDDVELAVLAKEVQAGIVRMLVEGCEYQYSHPGSRRLFEIRKCDDSKFFLNELVPNGRRAKQLADGQAHYWNDPYIGHYLALSGPNGLAEHMRHDDVPFDSLVRVGGGFSVDSIYLPSLERCAYEIARALLENKWYECASAEPDASPALTAVRELNQTAHYWAQESREQDAADQEQGLFSGCRSMAGPLLGSSKKEILSFLNCPSQAGWDAIRGLVVTGHGTLWQAWVRYDPKAPTSGTGNGFPSADTLRAAIRQAVTSRQSQIRERSKRSAEAATRVLSITGA